MNNHINRVYITADEPMSIRMNVSSDSPPAITVPLGTPLSVAARELILQTLEYCGGERKRTAEMLGICTKTLYNRLREYGIREERASLVSTSMLGEVRAP